MLISLIVRMRLEGLNEMSANSIVLLNCGRIIRLRRNPLILKQGQSLASCSLRGFLLTLLLFFPSYTALCVFLSLVCVFTVSFVKTLVTYSLTPEPVKWQMSETSTQHIVIACLNSSDSYKNR